MQNVDQRFPQPHGVLGFAINHLLPGEDAAEQRGVFPADKLGHLQSVLESRRVHVGEVVISFADPEWSVPGQHKPDDLLLAGLQLVIHRHRTAEIHLLGPRKCGPNLGPGVPGMDDRPVSSKPRAVPRFRASNHAQGITNVVFQFRAYPQTGEIPFRFDDASAYFPFCHGEPGVGILSGHACAMQHLARTSRCDLDFLLSRSRKTESKNSLLR